MPFSIKQTLTWHIVSVGESQFVTLGKMLDRYKRKVTPTKKGYRREELRIELWMKSKLAKLPLSRIRWNDLAE